MDLSEFRNQVKNQLNNLKPEEIIPYREDEPVTDNYTLVIRPTNQLLNTIQKLISQAKCYDEKQLYYKPENIHITILGNISKDKDEHWLWERITQVIKKYYLNFHAQGMASNTLGGSVVFYPVDFNLHELRDELRQHLDEKGSDFTIHLSCYEYLSWSNIFRYLETPNDKLLEFLRQNADTNFGFMKAEVIELYKGRGKILNDKYELKYQLKL